MTRNFWKHKKVLITGHTGFKGSWLSAWLAEMGADVTGYALDLPPDGLFAKINADERIHSIMGDIRDLGRFQDHVEAIRPEIVFHLAAQSLVRISYDSPVDTYSTNVMGTVNVLETARFCSSIRAVVIVTSDKCYQNAEVDRGYREDDRLGGRDPYSNSKACAELVVEAYRMSFFREFPRVVSVRAGNVIGGGDWAKDRLIPDLMRCMIFGEEMVIRFPEAVRPWQFVLDPLAGYLELAEKVFDGGPELVGAWNFGPLGEDARPVSWVVDNIFRLWGKPNTVRLDSNPDMQPHESKLLKLDSSKARQILNWNPSLPLATALQWTVDWYKCFASKGDVSALTLQQIKEYESHCHQN